MMDIEQTFDNIQYIAISLSFNYMSWMAAVKVAENTYKYNSYHEVVKKVGIPDVEFIHCI